MADDTEIFDRALASAIARANDQDTHNTSYKLESNPSWERKKDILSVSNSSLKKIPWYEYKYQGSEPDSSTKYLLSILGPIYDPDLHFDSASQDSAPNDLPVRCDLVISSDKSDGSIRSMMGFCFPQKDYKASEYTDKYVDEYWKGLQRDRKQWCMFDLVDTTIPLDRNLPSDSEAIHLVLMATNPDEQGKGHGRRLLDILKSVSEVTHTPVKLTASTDDSVSPEQHDRPLKVGHEISNKTLVADCHVLQIPLA
ncbi:hypothetical protein L486_03133 [Kwoniella mangroviensis CBS 10435]|uniref:N-acetyltransferase domain-containing protein n=1 Tax=Kwoniella mangroviensis CBS 10435 TaxID=1331196 RepID=A0A1B9ITA7_9TREE|nr:hypothetical protein L486_03133 [Kwoniella mangroviensis CBS 10435]